MSEHVGTAKAWGGRFAEPPDRRLEAYNASVSFEFDPATGLSNRFITPNGDGLNDFAVFTFSNPLGSEVVGRIFDLRGALVSSMSVDPSLSSRFNRVWDGKSNGVSAQPGIYIYRIEAEDKVYTGTVTVIR